jgi:hypothetical protein
LLVAAGVVKLAAVVAVQEDLEQLQVFLWLQEALSQ